MSTEDPQKEAQESQTSSASLVGRVKSRLRALPGWVKKNRLRAALLGGACIVSVGGVVAAWMVIDAQQQYGEPVSLDQVLEALDVRAYDQVREMAKRLQKQDTLSIEELGGPVFALGAAAAYEAESTWSKDKINYYRLAAGYLDEARDRGFPPGRRAEGLYLLGTSLYLSGRIPESRPVLQAALKSNKRKATEIHRLLAAAYLNDANPQLEEALAENDLFLADRKLPATARYDGLLQRAQILLRLERLPECTATLDSISAEVKNQADAIILRGRVLMHEARALKNKPEVTAEDQVKIGQKYEAARKTFALAQSRDTLATQAKGKAMYLIGVSYLESGNYRDALLQFGLTNKLYAEGPEGLAAGYQQADLSRLLGRDKEALAGYRQTLGAITDPKAFSNPWITLDELRSQMLLTYQHYLNTRNFEISLQLTRLFYPLFSRERTLELTAQSHIAWGESFIAQAEQQTILKKAELAELAGRAQFRQAGNVYARLAKTKVVTRQYPDELWRSATTYLQGHDYRNGIRMLQMYLKDQSRRRHPQALVMLGEARLALNEPDKALEDFQQCIEFHPRDAAAYRARLLASRAYVEKGELDRAEILLLENLNGEYLTPTSREWRDSLFALGELFYMQHRYEEAVVRLEEAVARYSEPTAVLADPKQALSARYLIARSGCQHARAAQEELKKDLPGETRVIHSKQINELFGKSLDEYEKIRQMLSRRQESIDLTPLERSILRNCYFAIGDVHFELGRYEDAVKSYSAITNRYTNRPEVLEAYVQIAAAHRRLNQPLEARSTLTQAKVVLGNINEETDFTKTTNRTREQWSTLLDWLLEM